MRLFLSQQDILEIPADVLICSANVSLNLSGGVGGELLRRYGKEMQEALHAHLPKEPPRYAKQGDVLVCSGRGTPYKAVIHAVAVDAFYDSSPAVIQSVVSVALKEAQKVKAQSLALTALATGFGHLTMADFASGCEPILKREYPPIKWAAIAVSSAYSLKELVQYLPWGEIGNEYHN